MVHPLAYDFWVLSARARVVSYCMCTLTMDTGMKDMVKGVDLPLGGAAETIGAENETECLTFDLLNLVCNLL